MADPLFINELIGKVNNGTLRIPSFQRGFVWDADRVAHLMDSIYKGFPFGSLLFWRTKHPLKVEKEIGSFPLQKFDADYPLDYILDGQQRATSIFGVFQKDILPSDPDIAECFKIYFDMSVVDDIQNSNFIYLSDNDVNPDIHFPLKVIFDPQSYHEELLKLNEEKKKKIYNLYTKFTQAKIPVQSFETNERAAVAIVFERINRMGIELDTLQLLSAWTWSEDFDLQTKFEELSEELEPFGFKSVGQDSDLLLRCCSAVLKNDASPKSIMELNGEEVRERFPEVRKGIFGAIDFLKSSIGIASTKNLPFSTIIIPLAVFFATKLEQDTNPTNDQRNILTKWIWKTFFGKRYSKRLEQLNDDIKEITNLKNSSPTKLGDFPVEINNKFFTENTFNLKNVDTKTFILLLAQENPKSFISGSTIALNQVLRESNKCEFHHIYPQKFLKSISIDEKKINSLVNFAIISRADNNKLGGHKPSIYKEHMPTGASLEGILSSAICPENIFDDDHRNFWKDRSKLLTEKAKALIS